MLMQAKVRGRVQGVGFRMTAKEYADELGLKGYARNCSDGSVELFVEGSKPLFDQFLRSLHQEFAIDSCDTKFYDTFDIL